MQQRSFTFETLVDLFKKYLVTLIAVTALAIIVGVVISLPVFMKPLFQSVAVVYPINIETYSDESETEQLLQYFEASSVRDSIIEKFNLYQRYQIDTTDAYARYYLIETYNERVSVSKTLYESVRLEVLDEDPQVAKAMADEILRQVNITINRLINEWGQSRAASFLEQMNYQQAVIDSIEAKIARISMDKNLLEYSSQSRELVRGYVDLLAKGNEQRADQLHTMLENAQESGSTVRMLQNISYMAAQQLAELQASYLKWRELGYGSITYLQKVVEPEVPVKKVFPIRWLVVAVSVLSALLLTLLILAVKERKSLA